MKRSITCRKRTKRSCKSAKRSCSYASGTKRQFCRKRRSTRRH